MKLASLKWVEICSLLADIGGCHLSLVGLPLADAVLWNADFKWRNTRDAKLPIGSVSSGLECRSTDSEEACKMLLLSIFRHCETFPGDNSWKISNFTFDSAEELEMKLSVAGVDVEFMLTHR